MGLYSVTGWPELNVFLGKKKKDNLFVIVDKWCRWFITLDSCLKRERVCIQAQMLEGVRWDLCATEALQGGGSEAWQSNKWKVLHVQPI